MRVYLITGLIFLLPFLGLSQGEFNQWRFGNNAGLSFNTLPPVSILGSAMFTYNSTASVSDSLGNVLFYSDGASVWNKNNQLMPNGSGLFGTMYNSQPVYAIQNLSNPNNYYVFYMGPYGFQPMFPQGLFYSVVDMQLNGGLGDIVTGMKNIPVPGGGNVANLMTGTRKHNNKDVWLVVRNMQPSNYLAYSITAAGINPIPVGSPSFITPTSLPLQWLSGEMKISQDGNRLVSNYVNDTIAEFCSFNSATGLITPHFTIRPQYRGGPSHYFGVEFSRNSNVLYFTVAYDGVVMPNIPGFLLFQYNAALNDSTQFVQSVTKIDSFFNSGGYQKLQLAPDGKIYSPLWAKDSLGIIHNPETLGSGCNFQRNAIGLDGKNVYYGLPQFLQKYKAYIHETGSGCQIDSINFTSDIWPTADSIIWNFGDPASGVSNLSTITNPKHLFSSPGIYNVELYVRHNDNRTDTTLRTVTIYPNPVPSLGPDRTICASNTVTFDAGFCSGCSYEWKDVSSGLIVGTNQTLTTGIDGMYCVNVTNGNGCTGKDTIQLSTTPVPVVTNNPPLLKSICTGESTNIPLFGNEPGIMFHWTATLTSGNIAGFSADSGQVINQILINNGATAGVVTYHITPKIGDCAGTQVDYAVTVNVGDPVDVTISASGNSVCAGTLVTFTATPVNPGNTPVYQWKVNGVNAGSNATTYAYTSANGDIVTCILTSSNTVCTSNNPATSNAITMVVNPIQPVSVAVSPSANPVCSGTTVNFTALPVNGGSNPSWLWKVNGLVVGSNAPVYSYVPVNGDAVTCTLTSNVQCPTGNPAISGTVTLIVNPNLPVGVSIVASSNPFCAGSSVTFTASPVNGGTTPGYQWKVNGINAGINSSVLIYSPANGDVITCSLLSSESCTSGNPAQSNPVTMVVNVNLPAGITIAASTNPFCPGSPVTFTANPVNGGPSPVFQWKVNGINSGSNASTFLYNPVNNDSVRCILTSNLNCVTGSPVSSAKIIMSGTLAPIVTFTSCFDTITTVAAKPFKLKGGIPLGGTFSGPGVNPVTGMFTPLTAGTGLKTILYTYTNVLSCSANKSKTILVQPNPTFTCGNNFTDIRDNKIYPTVQIGAQCWMQTNLDFGITIDDFTQQTDNCISERYLSLLNSHLSFYQWDELMRYDPVSASQGICPPGWHVPTSGEWDQLLSFHNGPGLAGGTLKDDLLPNGFHSYQTGFLYLNNTWAFTTGLAAGTMYWTSTSSGADRAVARGLNEYNMSVSRYEAARGNGFATRCLKD